MDSSTSAHHSGNMILLSVAWLSAPDKLFAALPTALISIYYVLLILKELRKRHDK